MKKLLALLLLCSPVSAQTFTSVPYTFAPNTAVIPGQLMADFLSLIASGNAVASNLNSKITALSNIPTKALVFFNLGSCPTGWSNAGGGTTFIRGLDNGAGNDTTGTLLGGIELSGTQDHTHQTTALFIGVGEGFAGGLGPVSFPQFITTATNLPAGLPSTGNHGSETRPANISLLLCSKN